MGDQIPQNFLPFGDLPFGRVNLSERQLSQRGVDLGSRIGDTLVSLLGFIEFAGVSGIRCQSQPRDRALLGTPILCSNVSESLCPRLGLFLFRIVMEVGRTDGSADRSIVDADGLSQHFLAYALRVAPI